MRSFIPGTQVAYVPSLARGNLKHEKVRLGFIVGRRAFYIQVRFFTDKSTKAQPSSLVEDVRREDLILHQHHDQGFIDRLVGGVI